jgi:hypothetical protein
MLRRNSITLNDACLHQSDATAIVVHRHDARSKKLLRALNPLSLQMR